MTVALALELVRILREASAVIRNVYSHPFSVAYKGPGDPVTVADERANELICEALARRFPGVPVVAEESDEGRFADFRQAPTVFFVDPLDGTREFVERRGEFVTMIGLVDGDRAIVGAVVDPLSGRACWGGPGLGAASLDAHDRSEPLRVSTTPQLRGARLVASRTHPAEVMDWLRDQLGIAEIRPLGSAGLKGWAVAAGEADAYASPFYGGRRWDACAIDALVSGAGGRFSDAAGTPIPYRGQSLANDRGLLCTNARLHDELLQRLESLRPPAGLARRR